LVLTLFEFVYKIEKKESQLGVFLSQELQRRAQKRWREELSGEDRRALLVEKESKKKRREAEKIIPISSPKAIDSSSVIHCPPAEKDIGSVSSSSTTTAASRIDGDIKLSRLSLSAPVEERKTLIQRSITMRVAPVETYVEENDRTRTTSHAFRLASIKSLSAASGTTSSGLVGGGGGHHFKETERRQSVRYGAGYVGHTCSMCGAFYAALATSALAATSVGSAAAIGAIDARSMCNCSSRHRSKFEQDPPTPPDYWDLSDDDWEDRIRR